MSSLEGCVLKLREHVHHIYTALKQPIPFPMYYTLMILLNVSLLVKSYSMIEAESWMSIPCFFIICFVLIGLKVCALNEGVTA